MIKRINLSLSPEDSHDETKIRAAVIEHLQASERINMTSYRLVRKSVDARSRQPVFRMQVIFFKQSVTYAFKQHC